MGQRDSKQEALHELELKVLKVLRPQLDEVMNQEQQIKQLSIALAQTQWEARTFISKESQIQGKLEELRQVTDPLPSSRCHFLARSVSFRIRCCGLSNFRVSAGYGAVRRGLARFGAVWRGLAGFGAVWWVHPRQP